MAMIGQLQTRTMPNTFQNIPASRGVRVLLRQDRRKIRLDLDSRWG